MRSRLIPFVAVLVDVGYVAYFFSYCTIYNFKNSVQNILKYGQFLIDKDKILCNDINIETRETAQASINQVIRSIVPWVLHLSLKS